MTELPDLPGALSSAELLRTTDHLARLQLPSGMIPWFPGGHCDPWNHVEAAMALDIAGRHVEAMAAYRWLAATQLPNGAWHNYYTSSGAVEEAKLDTNVCAYVATGMWHHWLSTASRAELEELWPTAERALGWVLGQRRDDGLALWAVAADGARPWDYALLTGTSSIAHALQCGARAGAVVGHRKRSWQRAAAEMTDAVVNRPEAFAPKERWAMDWYYPALSGVLGVSAAKLRLAEGWETFVMEDLGVRCVSDEPWVTASETAECALAHAVIGDVDTATDLLRWTRSHRRSDGSYWTGIVYSDTAPASSSLVLFPFDEHTSYTAAAIVLAADATCGATSAARVFSAPDTD